MPRRRHTHPEALNALTMDVRSPALKEQIRAILQNRQRLISDDTSLTCAAVLIPLLYREGEWHVVVTQRTQNVEHHKGQISFPGGACDPSDADLCATALREAWEEIGVRPGDVEVLGALDDFRTITDFRVAPFVGVIPHPYAYVVNSREVDAVVEVPLSFLCNEVNLRTEMYQFQGEEHEVLFWHYGPYVIWGATARILHGLLSLIR